jgi:hypothetical protein
MVGIFTVRVLDGNKGSGYAQAYNGSYDENG